MAGPFSVNSQITDAITQSAVGVVAAAPSMAMGLVYQSMGHSASLLFEATTIAHQNFTAASQASTMNTIMQMLAYNTMSGAAATEKLAKLESVTKQIRYQVDQLAP